MAPTFLYLLMTHQRQDQVLRLIDVLHRGGTKPIIVVRHNASVEPLDPRIANHPAVHIAPGQVPVIWGHVTYLDAVLKTVEWSLRHFEFDWVTLLSGQDYPLMPIRRIEHLQSTSGFDGFIQAIPLSRAFPAEQVKTRTEYRWFAVPWRGGARTHAAVVRGLHALSQTAGLQPFFRVRAAAGTDRVFIGRRRRMPDLGGLQLYGNSDWFTASRELIDGAVDFRHREPTAAKYLRGTLMPSEQYFPTVFMATSGATIFTRPVRFKWFPPDSAHPVVLTMKQLDKMLASECYFARKFDPRVDAEVLDELDRVIGGEHPPGWTELGYTS